MSEKAERNAETAPRRKELSAPAKRALKEAEERRRHYAAQETQAPREVGGREGPDPARYGDWEVKGIASDF
ncbi:DUF1674 domain-containing protein [Chelativorans sp. YIM 93263]|uniref:DUF1674 domain-containing protein n=1 Tax=Chelativorans sp. YIM 93263 TaxID=2906648 RepID=UPI0023796FBF|nr:DUF1674 domain-containing protein [Chelativorans sp. YIM 93263]